MMLLLFSLILNVGLIAENATLQDKLAKEDYVVKPLPPVAPELEGKRECRFGRCEMEKQY
jgi:hypothetical protein